MKPVRLKQPSRGKRQGADAARPPAPVSARRWWIVGWRAWALRLLLLVISPLLFLALVEGGLRLFGYGRSSDFFVPVTLDGAAFFTPNPDFARRFRCPEAAEPCAMAAVKPEGCVRIFILGESAARGVPDPAYSFGRILQVMLRRQFPDRRFEVVNTAIMGINSHALLPIARECLCHEPDLLIAYMGNNEIIGFCGAEDERGNGPPPLWLVRGSLWAKTTRTGQLLARWMGAGDGPAKDAEVQDEDFYRRHRTAADDPRRARVYDNFRANLRDICNAAHKSGSPLLVSTVPVNLKDCPPLGAMHRADLDDAGLAEWNAAYDKGCAAEDAGRPQDAVGHFLAAAEIDDRFADLHFHLGRCYLALDQPDEAREHYVLARDLDAMQFRADGPINDVIREVAAGREADGIELIDVERALGTDGSGKLRIPGEDLFYEHVHLNFAGNYAVARAMFPAVAAALHDALGAPPAGRPLPSLDECAAALAYTPWDEYLQAASIVRLTSKPPFTCQLEYPQRQRRAEKALQNLGRTIDAEQCRRTLAAYREAMRQTPDDWRLHFNLAYFFDRRGEFDNAVAEWQVALEAVPWHREAKEFLAAESAKAAENAAKGKPAAKVGRTPAKNLSEAQACFDRGNAARRQRRLAEAIAEFRRGLEICPDVPPLLSNLGEALLKSGSVDEAVPHLRRAIELDPNCTGAHMNLVAALVRQKAYVEGIAHLRRALELKLPVPGLRSRVAWLLATADDDRARNGREAVQLAEEACRGNPHPSPRDLDVLAAAYAEAGRFEEAVAAATKARDAADRDGDGQLAAAIAQRLALYKAGKAYRE